MKLLFTTATLVLLLAACAQPQQANTKPVAASHRYVCETGGVVTATYPTTSTATVHYHGKTVNMHLAISADGARYVGGGLEWWTKGSGAGSHGMLFEHKPGGTGGKRIEMCTER